jgi:hypothetical protein
MHPADGTTLVTLVYSHPVRLDATSVVVVAADGSPLEVTWAADDGRSAAAAAGGGSTGAGSGGDGGARDGGDSESGASATVVHTSPSTVWSAKLVDPSSRGAASAPLIVKVAVGGARGASGTPADAFEAPVPLDGCQGVRCASGRELLRRLAKYRLPAADLLEEQLAMCTELMGASPPPPPPPHPSYHPLTDAPVARLELQRAHHQRFDVNDVNHESVDEVAESYIER